MNQNWYDFIFGTSHESNEISLLEMMARAAFLYVATIAVLRLAEKRSLGDATVFDVVLGIIVGSIAGRAITGGAPMIPSIAAMASLIALHWCFSAIALRSSTFSRLIKGSPNRIIHNGKISSIALKQAHMTRDDLIEDLRQRGVSKPAKVQEAWLERSGTLSVVKKGD